MQTTRPTPTTKPLFALIAMFCLTAGAHAGLTQLTDSPLSSASSVSISPNIMFVLDDSGSMDWDYLPDWAGAGNPPLSQRKNPGFNGIAYNAETYYVPPKYFNADGSANTTAYLSQNSANTSAWTAVKNDGYGVQSTTTSNLVGNAYYYTTVVGEYCTNKSLKTCIAASAGSTTYPEPAKLRWCKTAADAAALTPSAGACQATQVEPNPAPPATATNIPFNYPRIPAPRTSTITISGSSSTSVSSITVDGKQILSATIAASSIPATLASAIESSVNACTFGASGNCQVVGYSAVASGSTVTISAPGAITLTPAITKSGTISLTPTAFARPATNLAPGENLLTVITTSVTPSPTYPKTSKRSDCAANPCTYDEEMTNFANWWAYNRTRMQSMKTATSLSFEPIGSNRRVGYMTINNNTSADFQNIAAFDATQKKNWYDKVFSAIPNRNTPLRVALSNAGRLYAGRLNSTTFNGVAVIDPVQYYCQENVTILSTDGYWNEGAGFKIDGSSLVGDQDGPTVVEDYGPPERLVQRPQLDGGSPQRQKYTVQNLKTLTPTLATWVQKKTEQLQSTPARVQSRTFTQPQTRTSQLQSKTGQWQSMDWKLQQRTNTQGQISTLTQLQEQTALLQTRSGPLQGRTANLQTRTKDQDKERTSQLQSQGGQRQSKTYQLQQRLTQVQKRTSSNGGTSWGGWANAASCSPISSGTNLVQCQTLAQSGWNDVSSCTVVAGGTTVTNPGTDSAVTTYTTRSECQYNSPSWTNVASCTPVAKSTASPYTVAAPVDCQTVWSGTWTNASSCTTSESVQCQYTAWTGYSNVESCTATPQSSGSPYTVGTARQCTTNNWSAWADTASTCVSSSTVGCQYGSFTSWTAGATCSAVAPSTGNPWTVTQKKECRVNYGSWSNTAACTPVDSGATQRECQYAAWSGWSNVASCSPTPVTGPPYAGPARNCQTVWTTPVDTATACVPSATTTCTTTWTGWADVPAPNGCTAVAGSSECRYRLLADWYNTASCTPLPRSTSSTYTVNQATDCQVTWPNSWVDATASCTPATDRLCQYASWSSWSNTGACTAQSASTASPYSVLTARECRTDWTDWSTTASCTPAAGATECNTTWPNAWVDAASCDTSNPLLQCRTQLVSDWGPALPASSLTDPPPTISGVTCTAGTVGGLTTSCRNLVPNPSLPIPVATCTAEAASSANGYIERTCSNVTTTPVDVDTCTPVAASIGNSWIATFCTEDTTSGPTDDTLADVAEYYWKTDLRDPLLTPDRCTGGPILSGGISSTTDVCVNNADLGYPRQYMKTFTLGLGASGLMQYDKEYLTLAGGDYESVKNGVLADPATGVCSWQTFGACNWPKPESNKQTNIDDLWHAAVNGRGKYYSAGTPDDLATGISDALSSFDAKDGALAAVTVSSPNLTAGDNAVFEISFKSAEWTGDIVKRTIDVTSGALLDAPQWPSTAAAVNKSAKQLLDEKVAGGTHTARSIYTYNDGGTDNLKSFTWTNLTATQQDYFLKPAINTLSQFCTTGTTCLDATTQDDVGHTVASGENLLKFIRGDKSHEGDVLNTSAYYRQRASLLGDIVGSEAVYVQKSPWNYADYKYSEFKTANVTRTGMVYVGANDGMLHAFNASTGDEAWAYIPEIVMPRLYKLADKNYAVPGKHEFFVDGTPAMGDICASNCATGASGTEWKTILVGGLNKGGRGYYALDVTDPAAPKALWEFTNNNLGYTFGNPVITKLKDGTWVVIFASGYNNSSPGDGEGRLFILNANTGTLIRTITTHAGDSTNPSGLSRISAWANFADSNNTAQRVYGGDLFGNLWRFDVNGDIPRTAPAVADYVAQRLATLRDASGNGQPITTRPELGKVKNHPVIYVGTGQLLGTDDLATTQTQSLYAIKDTLTDTDYGSPRPLSPILTTGFVAQTLTVTTCGDDNDYCTEGESIISATSNAVDFATDKGWYMDFPVAGERINTELRLQLKTLAFNTNTPQSGACVPVGVSHAYFVDYRTGSAVEGTDGMVGVKLGDFLSASPSVIRLEDGTIRELIRTDAPGTMSRPVPVAADAEGARRVSWRELITQ